MVRGNRTADSDSDHKLRGSFETGYDPNTEDEATREKRHDALNRQVLRDIDLMSRCSFLLHSASAVAEAAIYFNPWLHENSVHLEYVVDRQNPWWAGKNVERESLAWAEKAKKKQQEKTVTKTEEEAKAEEAVAEPEPEPEPELEPEPANTPTAVVTGEMMKDTKAKTKAKNTPSSDDIKVAHVVKKRGFFSFLRGDVKKEKKKEEARFRTPHRRREEQRGTGGRDNDDGDDDNEPQQQRGSGADVLVQHTHVMLDGVAERLCLARRQVYPSYEHHVVMWVDRVDQCAPMLDDPRVACLDGVNVTCSTVGETRQQYASVFKIAPWIRKYAWNNCDHPYLDWFVHRGDALGFRHGFFMEYDVSWVGDLREMLDLYRGRQEDYMCREAPKLASPEWARYNLRNENYVRDEDVYHCQVPFVRISSRLLRRVASDAKNQTRAMYCEMRFPTTCRIMAAEEQLRRRRNRFNLNRDAAAAAADYDNDADDDMVVLFDPHGKHLEDHDELRDAPECRGTSAGGGKGKGGGGRGEGPQPERRTSSVATSAAAETTTCVWIKPHNGVYRVSDILRRSGYRWQDDADKVLASPRYEGSLLQRALRMTTNGTEKDTYETFATLVAGEGCAGNAGFRADPPPNESLVMHLRLGDRDMLHEHRFKAAEEAVKTHNLTGVVLGAVLNFSPWSADELARHAAELRRDHFDGTKMANRFKFSMHSVTRSLNHLAEIVKRVETWGVKVEVRSQPDADTDVCYYTHARHFQEGSRGFGELMTRLNTFVRSRVAHPPRRSLLRDVPLRHLHNDDNRWSLLWRRRRLGQDQDVDDDNAGEGNEDHDREEETSALLLPRGTSSGLETAAADVGGCSMGSLRDGHEDNFGKFLHNQDVSREELAEYAKQTAGPKLFHRSKW